MVGGVSPSSFPIKISMKIEKILKNIPSARPQRMLGTCRYVSALAGGGGSAIPSRSFGEQRDGREGSRWRWGWRWRGSGFGVFQMNPRARLESERGVDGGHGLSLACYRSVRGSVRGF